MHRMPALRFVAVVGAAAFCACTSGRMDVASAFVKSSQIGPQGGSITVSSADDPSIAGTTITVPAGALSQAVVITVSQSAQPVAPSGARTAGPVLSFGPSGTTFTKPVTIQIPVALPAGSSLAELFIEAVESDGTTSRITPISDSATVATFQTSGFTNFGGCTQDTDGGPAPCQSNSDCPTGEICSAGACVSSAIDGGPGPCQTDSDCGQCQLCVSGVCEQSSCTLDGGGVCAAGQTDCGGVCSDTSADSANCGACGVVCPSGQACSQSRCVSTSGGCQSDSDCGQCQLCISNVCEQSSCTVDAGPAPCQTDTDCSQCQACVNGVCEQETCTCSAGQTDCSGVCADLSSDSLNCGACGAECPAGSSCSQGACGLAASDGGSAPACTTNSSCPLNEICLDGLCQPTGTPVTDGGPACRSNSDCPNGQSCVAGVCE